MSVPRNVSVPSHSSSPSRSSLRRTSGSHNPSARSLLPSPHFDAPRDNSAHDSPHPDESESAVEASHQNAHDAGGLQHQQQDRRPLQPFFTLIEDSVTHEHFHPTVHYIFADDDADIITEAALRSLEQNETDPGNSESQSQSVPGARGLQSHADQPTQENSPDNRYLPRPKEGVREHYIVLDVEPGTTNDPVPATSTEVVGAPQPASSVSSHLQQQPQSQSQSQVGFEVVNAYSMSADWQVLRTAIGKAPTMAEGEDEEGLMLRIEGRSGTPPDDAGTGKETVEDMIERFERGLEDVRAMMDLGRRAEAGKVEEESAVA